jgi:hypothetical protein
MEWPNKSLNRFDHGTTTCPTQHPITGCSCTTLNIVVCIVIRIFAHLCSSGGIVCGGANDLYIINYIMH